MWIETEITGTFTIKTGTTMVSFEAKREDGRNWAAPDWLVQQNLGRNPEAGFAVRIETEGDRIKSIQSADRQSVGAQARMTASKAPMFSGQAKPQAMTRRPAPASVDLALPYGFVPIDLDHAVSDEPIWHDGTGGGDLLCGEILCELEALTPLLPGNMRYKLKDVDPQTLSQWEWENIAQEKPEKQVAEPLRLPDGRVVIAGSAIKGMIRQSLGALTSAPMERVAEHHYSYRPNLAHADDPMFVCRPAVVDRKDGEEWIVKVLPGARDAIFRKDQIRADAIEFTYKGGIDGQGILAQSAPRKTYVYNKAWIGSARLKDAEECRISKAVFDAYLKTQRVLYTDHISPAHPQTFDHAKAEKAIKGSTDIKSQQLIYVEKRVDSNEIVSFGHHYQYRWAYTSSVRTKNGKPRSILTPSDCEQVPSNESKDAEVPPKQLTGARLLFGYVHDDKTNPMGKGVFERMAGRIAINHAVSDGTPQFLGQPEKGYCVPLKVLGQPKPSAWEFYLQQPEKPETPLVTYGDLPGDPGGELAGRKFYRHQKQTTLDDIRATTAEEERSDQATLARFICAPKTKFKFAVRFSSLRDWELGVLLAVLEPHLLLPDGKRAQYAHKLGLGKPLGMGSVRIERQGIRLRLEKDIGFLDSTDADNRVTLALKALQGRLNPRIKEQWLKVHEFYGKRLAYPLGEKEQTIYAWHTEVRRQYSKLRRDKSADWRKLSDKVRKADDTA